MVFSYYIYKYPYKIAWHLAQLFRSKSVIFYCADPLDYEMFLPIKKYLYDVTIVAKNKKTKNYLSEKGIAFKSMPAFPNAVIMARHEPYKFPVKKIIKIGFDHGLYQFKRWTSPKNYNGFNVYFVSSKRQVETAKSMGINSTFAIGYPKLDNAFNGFYNEKYLSDLKKKINIDPNKKTIIFTSTWNVEGLSALPRWIDEVHKLTDQYNILFTVHTWTEQKYIDKLRSIKSAYFIEEYDATPYLLIADIFVGDYSSIIGEFCALNKPIITFKVLESSRTIKEITELIKSISIQINNFNELPSAIQVCLENPNEKSFERKAANELMYFSLDGKAGERAGNKIKELLKKIN